MKKIISSRLLTFLCAIGGGVTGVLRLWFLNTGVDNRGLLITDHPGNILSFVLTAVVTLSCILLMPKEKTYPLSSGNQSKVAAVIGGVGCAAVSIPLLGNGLLPTVTGFLGIVAALCALVMMFTKPTPLLRCVSIVFLLLLPLHLYRQWSRQPQLPLYFFDLLGSVCLLLWAYQRTALETVGGNEKICLLMSRLGVFFCTAAVAGSEQSIFFVCGAAWMLLDSIAKDGSHDAS